MPASISSHSSSASPSGGIPTLPWKQHFTAACSGAACRGDRGPCPKHCPALSVPSALPVLLPSSALPQEQGWDSCQTPFLLLQWVLCAHLVAPAVAAHTGRMENREPGEREGIK